MSREISNEQLVRLWELKVMLGQFDEIKYRSEKGEIELSKQESNRLNMDVLEYGDEYDELVSLLVKFMPLSSNILQIVPKWWLIRYQLDSGDMQGRLEPINEYKRHLIEVDGRHGTQLTEKEYQTALSKIHDWKERSKFDELMKSTWFVALDKLRNIEGSKAPVYADKFKTVSVTSKNNAILNISDNVDRKFLKSVQLEADTPRKEPDTREEPNENVQLEADTYVPSTVVASYHAIERYVERILKVKGKANIEAKINESKKDIASVIEQWANDACIIHREEDNVYKFYDEKNIMIVLGEGNSVVTLYEKNFGFAKNINKSILYLQLDVMNDAKLKLDEFVSRELTNRANLRNDIELLEEEVDGLQIQIDLLQSKIGDKGNLIDTSLLEESALRHEYKAEYNKLFKKWDR